MSLFAILLTSFFFFPGFALAGISAPAGCLASWEWTYNTLNQDPCLIAAYMESTCNGGSFTLPPLPEEYAYTASADPADANFCECNTVTYSLLSACDACQGNEWASYAEYASNCSRVLLPSAFPNPVPDGTRVPYWARIDITDVGTWDSTFAYTIGDLPEAEPGTILVSDYR